MSRLYLVILGVILILGATPIAMSGQLCERPPFSFIGTYSEAEITITWDSQEVSAHTVWSYSRAYSRSFYSWTHPCAEYEGYCFGPGRSESYFCWCAGASAFAQTWGDPDDPPGICQFASTPSVYILSCARGVHTQQSDRITLLARTRVRYGVDECTIWGQTYDMWPSGFGAAGAIVATEAEFTPIRSMSQQARTGDVLGNTRVEFTPWDPVNLPEGMYRDCTLIYANSVLRDAAWQMGAGTNAIDSGLIADPKAPWEHVAHVGTFMMDTGSQKIELVRAAFTDEWYDVNGDGRFNALDPIALEALIDPKAVCDPNAPFDDYMWDLSGDGCIDIRDVEIMEDILALGLGSGIFGDFDRNGTVDCDDLDGVESHFGFTISDPEYRIELDENLDGQTDDWDRHWVYQAVRPGDVTADGVVNSADLSALLEAHGTCDGDSAFNPYADINRDGCVGSADLSILLSNFGYGCN